MWHFLRDRVKTLDDRKNQQLVIVTRHYLSTHIAPHFPRTDRSMVKDVVAMPTPVAASVVEDEAPRKKRRTLRDAEQELEACRVALKEARRKLIVTVRCPSLQLSPVGIC
jgi:hypothetical protein